MTDEQVTERPRRSFNLKNLYLDPNNYRFIDNKKHVYVEDWLVTDPKVQKSTRLFIEGKNQENIKDLIASFKSNGFMEVDVIQVKDLGDNNYLVLEGNRRVTALKCLQEDSDNGLDIGALDPSIFRKVPFEIHNYEDNEKHLVIMGLKHISGNKKWSTFNQARLIYDYLLPYKEKGKEIYNKKEAHLCSSLGVTKTKLRTMQRVMHLILEYKESDFDDQFESSKYGLFEEIIKKPAIKDWLDWDDDTFTPRNRNNLERIFSWISKTEVRISEDSDGDNDDFKDPYEEFEPIINKSLEIRDLSLFIDNESALAVMEEERSLAQGLVASGTVDKQNFNKALSKLRENLSSLSNHQSLITVEDTEQLLEAKDKLLSILPKSQNLNIEAGNYSCCFQFGVNKHFSSLKIDAYKGLDDLELKGLNRINIFAGSNNCGKTSLLEAVYLLSVHNDIGAFFKLIRLKNKLHTLNATWLNQTFDKSVKISGDFNNTTTSLEFYKFEASNIDKKDDYLSSYRLRADVDGRILDNVVHTFAHQPLIRENERVERLCASAFKSPYFFDFEEILKEHTKAVETKVESNSALKLVVDFVKKIDNNITDIRLVDDGEVKRFVVESKRTKDKDLDVTYYGEGLQRVFYIALAFSSCRNGVICIDEFETAIHFSLLIEFTKFVQELSEVFNVQVFLTSHSKECIDAFLLNDYSNESISGFFMEKNIDGLNIKQVNGDRFRYLIDNIDLDIRGDSDE
ncbi:AAA family ATPase [Shewanella vaxholmensis]|uniref:AAA family ATPase n=1 Tax=Shewanella vaxholmensis TaxID=3063535 RepID=A0ABU9URF0_9GAMM